MPDTIRWRSLGLLRKAMAHLFDGYPTWLLLPPRWRG
jgi:hypothetical protein